MHALRGVNLAIRKREFVAIIGASGSGKSTLFHILGGLTPATSGTVRINGRDLAGMTNAERTDLRKVSVGFVFQKYNLLPTLSAEDNIRIVQYIAGRHTEFDPAFLEILQFTGHLRQDEAQASCSVGRPTATGGDRAGHCEFACDSACRRAHW